MQKCMIAIPCVVDGSLISTFYYTMSCTCVCQLVCLNFHFKVMDSLMQDAWVSSYKQTDWSWPPIFRTIRLQQRDHSFRYSVCFPSVAVMALRRNVLQEDDIMCVLYVDTRSDVSDCSDNESLDSDSDSDVSTNSSHKQLWSAVVAVTGDGETSKRDEERSELENCDDKTSDVWCKTDKKPSNGPFLGTTGLNIVFHNPECCWSHWVQSLVTDLYSYLLNSLTFTTVEMQKNGKSRLNHWSSPISHLKKWESFWD